MKTVKVSEATPAQLNWLVMKLEFARLKANGEHVKTWVLERHSAGDPCGSPVTNWLEGGPIVEREEIAIYVMPGHVGGKWRAEMRTGASRLIGYQAGSAPLIAAMRCYVASKFGDVAEVPEELK